MVAVAVTLDDVKTHLNITDSTHDAELMDTLDRAVTRLAHEVGPLSPTSFTERHNGDTNLILLRERPVQSVTSLAYGNGTAFLGDELDVDTATGIVYGPFGGGTGRTITVTYLAGHDPLPADLAGAILEMVRHLWKPQRGMGGAPARAGLTGGEGSAYERVAVFPDLPYDVQKMIAPYRRSSSIA